MSGDRVIGRVKWFSTKKGFGFVTIVTPDSEHSGNDIFLHYSNINSEDYKRVFPGEYLETTISDSEDGRSICTEVTGLYRGPLLTDSETHRFKIFPKNKSEVVDSEVQVDENENQE